MNNRRKFLGSIAAVGLASTSSHLLTQSAGNQEKEKQDGAKKEATKKPTPERPKQLDSKMVNEFVGKSHGAFKLVKEMIAKEPLLVNASWDWGNGDFESGLNAASHVGNRPIAELLLEKGARMDVCAAVMLGLKGIVKEMLLVNPKLHTVRGAHTIPLLSHAIYGGKKADDVLNMLIDAGADVNIATKTGSTALMSAAGAGRAPIVELLLAKGADPKLKTSKGQTALDIAIKREKEDVIKLLKGLKQD